jgi:2-hydroxy-6-oxonona-2,4-dienedioate hydrolase/2-hydroxy-6-oxo-6-(2'-carboxyphenyl)-hexa-2,4-dienoate hydrolase
MSFWTEALGAEVKFYDAGGIRTRVIEAGKGEPVILMHGLSGHAETFVRNVVPIANAGYHVYAIDAIGHGFSDKPTTVTYNAPTFVDHLMRFMDTIGAKQAHLGGQSLGGWTAFAAARAHPERVLSLVSMTGAGILLEDEAAQKKSQEVSKQVQQVTQNAVQAPTLASVRKRMEWLMADPTIVPDELVETRYRIICMPDSQKSMPKMVDDVASPNHDEHMLRETDLAKIKTPTIIIWTDKNPTTPASVGKRASEIMPNARFELIANAGHWPQYEKAEIVNDFIIKFLDGQKAAVRRAGE